MSGYPPTNSGVGFPSVSPPYPSHPPTTNIPQYPDPGNNFYPGYPATNQQPNMMGGGDYPSQQGYQSGGGYPTSTQQPGYPNTGAGGGFQPEVSPTAPDFGQMEKIPGYENVTFKEEILTPPPLPTWEPGQFDRKPVENLPGLSEEEVRSAAVQFASEHCCYGSAVVRDMQVKDIRMMSAFHYKLETFTERRQSAWRFVAYNGQPIDGPMNGPAPSPWDITAIPPVSFQNAKAIMEVPHTAFVKPCHTCVGNGRVRCDTCLGAGRKQCTWCKGRGMTRRFDQDEMCTSCNATGFDQCFSCKSTGQVSCKTCSGKGNLKGFVELIVNWINHADDYISETSNMPKELVRSVTGQVAFEEENPRVYAIVHPSDPAVSNASNEYVSKHSTAFRNERILKQRQILRLIPIGQIRFQWKNTSGEFYVYGYEHKVHFIDYPQKCCCCSIL